MKNSVLFFVAILCYYTPYTYYVHYFAGHCSTGDIGIAGLCQTQGSFWHTKYSDVQFTAISFLRKRFMQVITWIS